ncbi:MAG: hypothetical protein AUI50_03145 [Crenarchaeota archaeon 13_1_40CM_2_52_14]|nr:MAG: hypothetical protein AUI97_05010 [Crenarchaeota archaeon 13_1_40CM_3_52_17]OLD35202.1 MAG: hypothetical protein AUI50_03145 [Crenarchaeota archaeon 13_1_40CM_2_52_14]OLE71636.1 MAG: hypothetical protein AUF78_00940 [archaeon 13_1_20CM_2_51_12]
MRKKGTVILKPSTDWVAHVLRLEPRDSLKSALISKLGHAPILAIESFGRRPRFPVIFPFHPSPDPALNRKTRRFSMPDRKISL